jgi:hypothetical protein
VQSSSGTSRHLSVKLNDAKPRLGAVCDLTGWRKNGITSAGNESMTIFQGPYSLTGSGIIDKGIVFMRVRLSNNSTQPLKVDPSLFSATDGAHRALTVLSPKDVMCYLYGEKGAQMLSAKHTQKETLDADTMPGKETHLTENSCGAGASIGRVSGADLQYAQANADYVAGESLWPATLTPGNTVDGLIYLTEPSTLPLTLQSAVDDKHFSISFGTPQATQAVMKTSDLSDYFDTMKKGTPLRVTLKKGKVFVGRFSSYDNIDEKVWFDTPDAGLLRSTSFPLTSIRSAEAMDPIPAKAAPVSEHVN